MTSRFPDTQWSLIQRAGEESTVGTREEMGELLQRYWRPMFVHLRYKGLSEQRAEDLIQDFVVEILSKDLLSLADPKKGRFRTLLLTALDRFVISRYRYETAAKRSPGSIASLEQMELDASRDEGSDAGLHFERAWALDVLAESVARMEQECQSAGEAVRWEVFRRRIIEPLLDDAPLVEYEVLAEENGLSGPKQAMNLVVTAKRQFARVLRDVIREYVTRTPRKVEQSSVAPIGTTVSADENSLTCVLGENQLSQRVEQELNDLRDVLGRSGVVSDLADELRRETQPSEPKKFGYWRKLTRPASQDDAPWSALFTLGVDESDENFGAALEELFRVDMGRVLELEGREGQSVRDGLLERPTDPGVLKFLKITMNMQRFTSSPTLPGPVANAMYFLIAFVENDDKISGLEDPQLVSAFEWLLEQSWFSDQFRPVVREALDRLQSES